LDFFFADFLEPRNSQRSAKKLDGVEVDLVITDFDTGDVGEDVGETGRGAGGSDALCACDILCIF